jgi:hypothetical protein
LVESSSCAVFTRPPTRRRPSTTLTSCPLATSCGDDCRALASTEGATLLLLRSSQTPTTTTSLLTHLPCARQSADSCTNDQNPELSKSLHPGGIGAVRGGCAHTRRGICGCCSCRNLGHRIHPKLPFLFAETGFRFGGGCRLGWLGRVAPLLWTTTPPRGWRTAARHQGMGERLGERAATTPPKE